MNEILTQIYIQFYCLSIPTVVSLVFILTAFFHNLKEKYADKNLWKPVMMFALLVVITIILLATVVTRETGNLHVHDLIPFHSYREVMNGGNIEILRSNFMNVILFYPAGLLLCSLLPKKWYGWCKALLVLLVFGILSGGVEYAQYRYALGRVEIDDVLHNSLGALLGSIFSLIPLKPWLWFQLLPPAK